MRSSAKLGALLLAGILSGCLGVRIEQNHDKVTQVVGDEVDLICTANVDKKDCIFTFPNGKTITVYEGVNYDNNRITANVGNSRECGINIKQLQDTDNGEWKCQINVIDENNSFHTGEGSIAVTVAIPPERLQLRVNQEPSVNDKLIIKMNEEEQAEIHVDCIAQQTRPRPIFKWFIGDTEIDGVKEDTEENNDGTGKADYIQTLTYHADSKHNGQPLKCEVVHQGYTQQAKENEENIISRDLELFFKPQSKPKAQHFYGLKVGQAEQIKIKFQANPRPELGAWRLEGVAEPVVLGTASVDNKFKSGFPEPEELPGEYSVTLTINEVKPEMAGKKNVLELTNDYGTTQYEFFLELKDKPPAEPMQSTPIIGVVVVIVIVLILVVVAVVARSKGVLCFAAKNGEQLQEEKETAAFDNAEKGEPLNPKAEVEVEVKASSPEKKEQQSSEQAEKKSNGAHTPV